MNGYSYTVYKHKQGYPLHLVQYETDLCIGFKAFCDSLHAQKFIRKLKERDGDIPYIDDFSVSHKDIPSFWMNTNQVFCDIETKEYHAFN